MPVNKDYGILPCWDTVQEKFVFLNDVVLLVGWLVLFLFVENKLKKGLCNAEDYPAMIANWESAQCKHLEASTLSC